METPKREPLIVIDGTAETPDSAPQPEAAKPTPDHASIAGWPVIELSGDAASLHFKPPGLLAEVKQEDIYTDSAAQADAAFERPPTDACGKGKTDLALRRRMHGSDQELLTFNVGCAHLAEQGRQAQLGGNPRCVYRGEGGSMCAAGPFIPDALYTQDIEGTAIRRTVDDVVSHVIYANGYDAEVARRLQHIHDNVPPIEWGLKLRELAGDLGYDWNDYGKSTQKR